MIVAALLVQLDMIDQLDLVAAVLLVVDLPTVEQLAVQLVVLFVLNIVVVFLPDFILFGLAL